VHVNMDDKHAPILLHLAAHLTRAAPVREPFGRPTYPVA
jgi:hypothetical protein